MLRNFLQPRTEEIVDENGLGGMCGSNRTELQLTARNSLNVLREIFPGRLVSDG